MRKLILFTLLLGFCQSYSQNVGIGTNTPTGPLSFPSSLGNKIVLWGDGNTAHYGIGVQGAQFQIYSNLSTDNIVFGYGKSSAFTERMRIINAGGDGMNLYGRMHMRNGTNPLDQNYGAGIWLYRADNAGALGFMGVQNNQNLGFYGGPAGWGFTYDAVNSRVGIGNNNPNAPLAFPPALGKKITLYPGATGDVGFGVAGNRLQIYSDNPNADVALGYDAAGTFNERFAVKPNGALAVNGNTGQAGQELVSNGAGGSAYWSPRPSVIFFTRSGASDLTGSNLCVDINGINGNGFSLQVASMVTYNLTMDLYGDNGTFGGNSKGSLVVQLLNSGGSAVSSSTSHFSVGNYSSSQVVLTGVGDLPAGNYTILARIVRNATGDGNTNLNSGFTGLAAGCNNFPINLGQLIMTIIPK